MVSAKVPLSLAGQRMSNAPSPSRNVGLRSSVPCPFPAPIASRSIPARKRLPFLASSAWDRLPSCKPDHSFPLAIVGAKKLYRGHTPRNGRIDHNGDHGAFPPAPAQQAFGEVADLDVAAYP